MIACVDKIQNVINERDAIIAYKERMSKTQYSNTSTSQQFPNMADADENVNRMLEMVSSTHFLIILWVI